MCLWITTSIISPSSPLSSIEMSKCHLFPFDMQDYCMKLAVVMNISEIPEL